MRLTEILICRAGHYGDYIPSHINLNGVLADWDMLDSVGWKFDAKACEVADPAARNFLGKTTCKEWCDRRTNAKAINTDNLWPSECQRNRVPYGTKTSSQKSCKCTDGVYQLNPRRHDDVMQALAVSRCVCCICLHLIVPGDQVVFAITQGIGFYVNSFCGSMSTLVKCCKTQFDDKDTARICENMSCKQSSKYVNYTDFTVSGNKRKFHKQKHCLDLGKDGVAKQKSCVVKATTAKGTLGDFFNSDRTSIWFSRPLLRTKSSQDQVLGEAFWQKKKSSGKENIQDGEVCKQNTECASGVCHGNLHGMKEGLCGKRGGGATAAIDAIVKPSSGKKNIQDGKVCKQNTECASGVCHGNLLGMKEGLCGTRGGGATAAIDAIVKRFLALVPKTYRDAVKKTIDDVRHGRYENAKKKAKNLVATVFLKTAVGFAPAYRQSHKCEIWTSGLFGGLNIVEVP